MIKNIKVDIVYFMTATDFEFEFNLGSCCHMRLLNDKAKDKKSFVNSLARAVSRSQIIICCGPLFGDDGLIATAAAAIGHGLKTVVNEAYGIESQNDIEIIDGAIPLVTPEGYFGGCVIESGNQSIIVLTENRTVRKSIMKTLIHPYIEDMSIMQSADKGAIASVADSVAAESAPAAPAEPPAAEPEPEPEPETSDEPEDARLQAEPEPDDTGAAEVIPDEPQDAAVDESGVDEPAATADEPVKQGGDAVHNIEFDYFDDEPAEPVSEDKPDEPDVPEEFLFDNESETDNGGKMNIPIIIVAAILILAIIGLSYFLIYLPLKNGVSPVDYFKRIFDTTARIGVLGRR